MVNTREKSSSVKSEKSEKRSGLPIKVISKSPSRSVEASESSSSKKKRVSASPSRKLSTRKSPSRPLKSPVRSSQKSPVAKITGRRSVGDRKSPTRLARSKPETKKMLFDTDTDSDTAEISAKVSTEKPKAAVRGRARNIESEEQPLKGVIEVVNVETEYDSGIIRRSARISQQREVERVIHVRQDSFAQKLSEFSDDDDIVKNLKYINSEKTLNLTKTPERASKSTERLSDSKYDYKKFERFEKYEFGGTFGSFLLIFFIPILTYAVNLLCNKNSCMFSKFPDWKILKNTSTYFDVQAWSVYYGFVSILFVLSALPFGGKKISGLLNKQGILEYRMSGFFSSIIVTAIAIGLSYYTNFPMVQIVTEKYFQLISAALVFGIVLSVVLYVRSLYVPVSHLNPHAVTKSAIYNFWMGREMNPRFFGVVDVKMYLYRCLIISSLIMNGMFLYKNLLPSSLSPNSLTSQNITFSATPLVLASLQAIYFLDGLIFESSMVSTFEIQYEGVGWMLAVGYLLYPFMATTLLKYVTEYNVQLPWYQLVAATTLFLIGYVLCRASNLQKDSFRKNPYDPNLAHLETIPTTQGKRLLVSGYWGLVRHPNYLGDILMLASFIFFVKLTPPLLFCLFDIAFLIARAARDGQRCKQRYGAAWDIYCQRVKYVLVPKVY